MGVVKNGDGFSFAEQFHLRGPRQRFCPSPRPVFHRRQFDSRRHSRAFREPFIRIRGNRSAPRFSIFKAAEMLAMTSGAWPSANAAVRNPIRDFQAYFDFKACGATTAGPVNGQHRSGVYSSTVGDCAAGSSSVLHGAEPGRTPSSALLSDITLAQESISSRSHAAAAPLEFFRTTFAARTRPDDDNPVEQLELSSPDDARTQPFSTICRVRARPRHGRMNGGMPWQ